MVIPRIFHRSLYSVSYSVRMIPLGTNTNKRFFFKKSEIFTLKIISRNFSAYESDGKTVGFVLNKRNAEELLIDGVTAHGFIMSSLEIIGSLIVFPHALLSWNISSAKDVNEDSLVLFKLMEPKIDILVFGYGSRKDYPPEVRLNFTKHCKNLGIRFEALPTEQAIGTYNFLASDRRLVAAALIPPGTVDPLKFDRSKPLLLDDGEEDEDELTAIDAGTSEKKLLK